MSREILIVGAGIVGLGIGWQLARRGCRVRIVERDEVAAGATGAAAGMLAADAEVEFEETALMRLNRLSRSMFPRLVRELSEDSDVDVDYRREGTLVVALDRDDAEEIGRLLDYHHELGLETVMLDGARAREREPGLSPNITAALWCGDDRQIDPRRLARALAEAFVARGGELREGAPVTEVVCEEGAARGVMLEDGTRYSADVVVLAAGAWTRRLDGVPPDHLPRIRPVRGQMLALDLGSPPVCRHVLRAPDAYLAPKSDGRLLVGATMEEVGFDERPTAGGIFELLRGAWETLPAIYDQALLDIWTGFRPVSLDNEPVLGPTSLEGLWIASGHGRNGILLSAVTAYEMSEAIACGELSEILAPFRP